MSAELKRAGYCTGYVGKWHLDGAATPGFVPPERRRGFDYWAAYNVAHRHYGSVYFRDTPEPIPLAGFEPDSLTDLAIDFLRRVTPRTIPLAFTCARMYLSPSKPRRVRTPRLTTASAARSTKTWGGCSLKWTTTPSSCSPPIMGSHSGRVASTPSSCLTRSGDHERRAHIQRRLCADAPGAVRRGRDGLGSSARCRFRRGRTGNSGRVANGVARL